VEDLMARQQAFISRVRLRNYRSIAACDVRLDPLTILIGPNGSGKSNFLDALAFMARAIETTPYQAIEERGGLDAILRAAPGPTDSLRIEVEVMFPREEGPPEDEASEYRISGAYSFEVARGVDREKIPFRIQGEECSLRMPGRSLHFEVRQGHVQDFSHGTPLSGERIEPDQLYLPVAGKRKEYSRLSRFLREMHFYSFAYDTLREPQPATRGATLGARGQQLASVLGDMENRNPHHKARLDAYLRAIVPGLISVDQWIAGPYLTLKLQMSSGIDGRPVVFDPSGMSDGTLRALGVLVALFQPSALSGTIPLVGIEEPEISLHPAAAGVLFDALTEASNWVQVLATSQSPDLLDRDDLDVNIVRAVSMEHGLTTIGEVDGASRRIIRDRLYTLGELMRSDQIFPSIAASEPDPGSGAWS
jgi:predicted ATPase